MLHKIYSLVLTYEFYNFYPPRVDVTEVQIAIVVMYVMSAFGGVALWDYRVWLQYIYPSMHTNLTHTPIPTHTLSLFPFLSTKL